MAWVILGIFIWAYTTFIEGKMNGQTFPLFRALAVFFMIWGGIRLTKQYWLQPKKKREPAGPPKKRSVAPAQGSPHQSHQHVRNPQGSPHRTHQHVKPHRHPGHSAHTSSFRNCPHCHHRIAQQTSTCLYCHGKV